MNKSWIRRRVGDPCGFSLEWSDAVWWLKISAGSLDKASSIFCCGKINDDKINQQYNRFPS